MRVDTGNILEELKKHELNCRYDEGIIEDGSPYTGHEHLTFEKSVLESGLLTKDQITEVARTTARIKGDEYCGNHRMWAIFRLLGLSND